MSDGKYFSTTKKGEIPEFKDDLHSLDKSKRKDSVKKVIAAMTVGKDVSMLFADVVNCMQTEDLELKKLVYLYLINYAKTQPDLAIMAVNTFVKDSQDPNPLIRALAVRTMGCIRVDKITEYLCDPLQRTLKDDDPYVRKTAAMCVAKLHDINAELVEDRGFLEILKDLLADVNPMVVANAVAALAEINDVSGRNVFQITSQSLFKLLRALNECTEWGQVFILDSLATYQAQNAKDAESIIERVAPRLQHANSAVVLSAVKVIMRQLDAVGDDALRRSMHKKMAPPLVTLLSGEAEIQYVALRNISLVVQRYPQILAHEVKVFFCKYNDPIYVKMEKLEIMIQLASERTIDQVLLEFKEYAAEVDVDFVRKSVHAIGRCAVALDIAAERCINVLLELIKSKVNYVVQECIVVIKDIFRRYPNKYESIIATLCENLDTLDEPEAKASMIWIIGEYAERIDNADELLEYFLEAFPEESSLVQLQLVTATVKLFLKKPTERPQQMIQLVLTYATQETDNPDLRDRAYIYWRLLSTDPEAAKEVVLSEKPVIDTSSSGMEPALLDNLLANLSSLASVYHKPPETFVSRTRLAVQRADEMRPPIEGDDSSAGAQHDAMIAGGEGAAVGAPAAAAPDLLGDLLDVGGGPASTPAPVQQTPPPQAAAPANGVPDILGGLGELDLSRQAPQTPPPQALDDPFAPRTAPQQAVPQQQQQQQQQRQSLPVLLTADKGKGLTLSGRLAREGGQTVYLLELQNGAGVALDGFMIQFNKNAFGLAPANQNVPVSSIAPNSSAAVSVQITQNPAMLSPAFSPVLQVAIRNNQQGVFYFSDAIPLPAVLREEGALGPSSFVPAWRALPDSSEAVRSLQFRAAHPDAALPLLQRLNFSIQARKPLPGSAEEVVFLAASASTLPEATHVLLEIRFAGGGSPQARVAVRCERAEIAPLVFDALQATLG